MFQSLPGSPLPLDVMQRVVQQFAGRPFQSLAGSPLPFDISLRSRRICHS